MVKQADICFWYKIDMHFQTDSVQIRTPNIWKQKLRARLRAASLAKTERGHTPAITAAICHQEY